MFEQDKICQVLVQALGLQRWGRKGFSAVFWGRIVLCSVLRIVERSAVFPTPARKARGAPAQLWQPKVPSANAKYPLGIKIGPGYEVLSWTNEDLLSHELVFLPWERESQQTYFLEKRNIRTPPVHFTCSSGIRWGRCYPLQCPEPPHPRPWQSPDLWRGLKHFFF